MTSSQALAKREKRVRDGVAAAAAEAKLTRPEQRMPTQDQMMLPLLRAIDVAGGAARPADVYDAVADALAVAEDVRSLTADYANGRTTNLFERKVRWTRQTAIRRGLVEDPARGVWALTEKAGDVLKRVKPGVVVTVFETSAGVALWARAEEAAGLIEPGSVDLIMTSPPYPILKGKAYGGIDVPQWLDWMTGLAASWQHLLADTGSLVVNLGQVYRRGAPVLSPYIERFTLALIDDLGYRLADRLYWHNPTKMASPMAWVAVRRVRVKPSVEPLLWFSKGDHPKADNRRVLRPYADTTVKRCIGKVAKDTVRPSGIDIGAGAFSKDNGGAIPNVLIEAANASSSDAWRKACRERDLDIHPATFPAAVPDFVIRLMTEAGDTVYDPFFGSGTTGRVAESLGRRWIGTEASLAYLEGAAVRFENETSFEWLVANDG